MPDTQPSPEAMRAAYQSIDSIEGKRWHPNYDAARSQKAEKIATIIDREMERKWIKCSERMPDERVWVLATYGEGIQFVGARRDENWINCCDEEDIEDQEKITHWMALPEDPEPEDAP